MKKFIRAFLNVVSWLVPHDFRYYESIKDVVFIKHVRQKQKQRDSSERALVSIMTNFRRNTNSARLIIQVELYHWKNKQLILFYCVSLPYHDTTLNNVFLHVFFLIMLLFSLF